MDDKAKKATGPGSGSLKYGTSTDQHLTGNDEPPVHPVVKKHLSGFKLTEKEMREHEKKYNDLLHAKRLHEASHKEPFDYNKHFATSGYSDVNKHKQFMELLKGVSASRKNR